MRRIWFIALLFAMLWQTGSAEITTDTLRLQFRVSQATIDSANEQNIKTLQYIDNLRQRLEQNKQTLQKYEIIGAASPDGPVALNERLSKQRARVLAALMEANFGAVPHEERFLGRDWAGLAKMVAEDEAVPYRSEVMILLCEILDEANGIAPSKGDPLRRIKRLRGGVPYRYMLRNLFPALRNSKLCLWYESLPEPEPEPEPEPDPETVIEEAIEEIIGEPAPIVLPKTGPWIALKTNLLYDAALVPNIGVEVWLKNQISVSADWMYAWWKNDHSHWYWRTYGGDIAVRYWLGKKAQECALTGHHLGVYGQMLTYDFETGGKGYLAPKWSWATGVEYGYSIKACKRLHFDFVVALGYMGGKYHEYTPDNGHYLWKTTKQRRYFGPTRVEASLVWIIGPKGDE